VGFGNCRGGSAPSSVGWWCPTNANTRITGLNRLQADRLACVVYGANYLHVATRFGTDVATAAIWPLIVDGLLIVATVELWKSAPNQPQPGGPGHGRYSVKITRRFTTSRTTSITTAPFRRVRVRFVGTWSSGTPMREEERVARNGPDGSQLGAGWLLVNLVAAWLARRFRVRPAGCEIATGIPAHLGRTGQPTAETDGIAPFDLIKQVPTFRQPRPF